MNISDVLANLAFLCLFHTIGGLAIGYALRKLRQGISMVAIFFLIWGSIFGISPFGNGWQIFLKAGLPLLVILEAIVFVTAAAGAFFASSEFVGDLRSRNVTLIMGGGIALVIGLVVGMLVMKQNIFGGLLFLVGLGITGIALIIFGTRGLLEGK